MKKAATLLVVMGLAVFGLAACGGDDDEDETAAEETTPTETLAGAPESTVSLSAPPDGSFAFDQEQASAKPGAIEINFENPATLSHDVVVEDQQGNELGRTELIAQDETSTTVELQRGTYTYFCDVAGHREGGMEGTLTVK